MDVYLVVIYVYAKTDEYPSLRFQDIRNKPKCHGQTHGRTDGQREISIPHHKQSLRGGGINITFWLEYFISYICYVSYVGNVWLGSLASIDVFRSVGHSPTSQLTKQIFF